MQFRSAWVIKNRRTGEICEDIYLVAALMLGTRMLSKQ